MSLNLLGACRKHSSRLERLRYKLSKGLSFPYREHLEDVGYISMNALQIKSVSLFDLSSRKNPDLLYLDCPSETSEDAMEDSLTDSSDSPGNDSSDSETEAPNWAEYQSPWNPEIMTDEETEERYNDGKLTEETSTG